VISEPLSCSGSAKSPKALTKLTKGAIYSAFVSFVSGFPTFQFLCVRVARSKSGTSMPPRLRLAAASKRGLA